MRHRVYTTEKDDKKNYNVPLRGAVVFG